MSKTYKDYTKFENYGDDEWMKGKREWAKKVRERKTAKLKAQLERRRERRLKKQELEIFITNLESESNV